MYDLVVVGAGPAGSSAARAAAKAGLYVLLLEKESFPRYKPCGGALSNKAISLLDFPLPEELCERTIIGARVHFRNKVIEGHKGHRLITLVTRSKFDNFLLQKAKEAGCNTITMKVEGYREKEDHVEVVTKRKKFKSRFLVIASGCQSSLKNSIQERATRDQYGNSMVAEIEEDEEIIQEKWHDSLDLYFDVADTGYGWIFPHKGYCSVGIWGQASHFNNLKANMQKFLVRAGFRGKYRLHGHRIPLGGFSRRVASGRVILAGDSAGFVDPFNGEGIYYALRSGQIGVQAILEQEPMNVSRVYEDLCKKDFGEELGHALRLLHLLDGRREIYLDGLIKKEDAVNHYLDIIAAKETYKGFVSWLLPVIIQIYINDFNRKMDRVPKVIKGLLGQERINLKIICSNRSVLRTGFYFGNARIFNAVEGGLKNPTITIAATESAMHRIERSNDPVTALERERRNGGLAITGKTMGARIKLDVLLSRAGAIKLFNNFFD